MPASTHPLGRRAVAALGASAVPIAWVFGRAWYARVGLPPAAPWGSAGLVLLAVALVLAARRDLRRAPQGATAVLALSQAAMIAGALAAGWHAGLVLALLGDLDATSVRRQIVQWASTSVAALVLCLAGRWGQSRCRIRP